MLGSQFLSRSLSGLSFHLLSEQRDVFDTLELARISQEPSEAEKEG
jgi:hypothetical protein